ncbi:MAG: phosphomannomutase/phosphoglucomutase [Desulfohalobiaceae bacterium]|nr:phosphomannomutase/phosphoglucomutase [Desulfohalobiaceae bacterium]
MGHINPDCFRAYDIRGLVDEDFDPRSVEELGRACGTYFRQLGLTRAVVGRDNRHSSTEYQASIVRGLVATGVDAVMLPMVPTPVFYYTVSTLGCRAGVMITASHNPSEYNGFKVWAGDNTIHTDQLQKIRHILESGEFETGQGVASELDPIEEYMREIAAGIQLREPVRVVVDGGNGSAGRICASLLERIGAEVIPIYCESDPNFPNHHPDPTVMDNIRDLKQAVLDNGAHAGIGLDGDGDRIGVVDEGAGVLYGDQLLAIFARDMLRQHPGAHVIGEVKCSHLLFKDIEEHGGQPLMWKTGHSLIKDKMRQVGAKLAGEMSGHMFFADRYYGFDDAIYASARLTEIMSQDVEKPLSAYLNNWPETHNTPEIRLDCPDNIKFRVVDKAVDYFKGLSGDFQVLDVDGVRINFSDGWGLVRASNTQAVLVMRFEAETEKQLREIREFFEAPLQGWIEELRG